MNGLISALTIGGMLLGGATFGLSNSQQNNSNDNSGTSTYYATDSSSNGRGTSSSINVNISNSSNTGGINAAGSVGANGTDATDVMNGSDASLTGSMRFDRTNSRVSARGTISSTDSGRSINISNSGALIGF